MKLLAKFNAIFDHIIDSLAYVSGGIIVLVMVAIFIHVIVRKLVGSMTIVVVEVSAYLMVYLTFLGTAWLLKQEGHVKMDLLLNRLRPRAQIWLNMVTSVVGVMVCLSIAWSAGATTWGMFRSGIEYTMGVGPPPWFLLLLPIPIGFFLLSIQFIRRTHGYLKTLREP
ncbi:TRAP transporter small permease subunit [Chloroflexota bacterium]